MTNAKAPLPGNDGINQDQFLTILSREDAIARFEAALFPRNVPGKRRKLADALGVSRLTFIERGSKTDKEYLRVLRR